MDLLILLVVIGIVIAFVVNRSQRREKQREAEALQKVKVGRRGGRRPVRRGRHAARQRDRRPPARRGDPAGLPARAGLLRRGQGRARPGAAPDDIRGITGILEDGRYAVACVQARLAGKPVPARLPPCFFNPQHGPSSENVDWAPPGGVPRSVPACPADAERVREGAEPDMRKVPVGAGRAPVLAGRPRLRPLRPGLLLPVRDVRPAARPVPRLAAVRRLRRRRRVVLRRLPGRPGLRRRRWRRRRRRRRR